MDNLGSLLVLLLCFGRGAWTACAPPPPVQSFPPTVPKSTHQSGARPWGGNPCSPFPPPPPSGQSQGKSESPESAAPAQRRQNGPGWHRAPVRCMRPCAQPWPPPPPEPPPHPPLYYPPLLCWGPFGSCRPRLGGGEGGGGGGWWLVVVVMVVGGGGARCQPPPHVRWRRLLAPETLCGTAVPWPGPLPCDGSPPLNHTAGSSPQITPPYNTVHPPPPPLPHAYLSAPRTPRFQQLSTKENWAHASPPPTPQPHQRGAPASH